MEEAELRASIVEYFAKIPDPRVERTRHHSLVSMLVPSPCAVICGADSFVTIEEFGKAKRVVAADVLTLTARHSLARHGRRRLGSVEPGGGLGRGVQRVGVGGVATYATASQHPWEVGAFHCRAA